MPEPLAPEPVEPELVPPEPDGAEPVFGVCEPTLGIEPVVPEPGAVDRGSADPESPPMRAFACRLQASKSAVVGLAVVGLLDWAPAAPHMMARLAVATTAVVSIRVRISVVLLRNCPGTVSCPGALQGFKSGALERPGAATGGTEAAPRGTMSLTGTIAIGSAPQFYAD